MRRFLALALALFGAACVPADEALSLGSVQFLFTASDYTVDGARSEDQYALRFDRVVLGFKTMTVGKIGAPDTCSYRGRGAITNAVFDPRHGLVQTFNGIQPVECPDVGVIFGTPDDATVPAEGTPPEELVALANEDAHAIIEATATPPIRSEGEEPKPYKILLRFEPIKTSTRFGGCRGPGVRGRGDGRGVGILAGERDVVGVHFAAENLFRNTPTSAGDLRVAPFAQADRFGNDDRVVTMDELDRLPLTSVPGSYQLPSDESLTTTRAASFGDFVRFLFRFTVLYRNQKSGLCVGNPPGGS
ncbi:MAG: hypothetical protein KIT84_02260 [Labilithrix sp.]|nr:hypothetical protein [Labilithrix sp.]MCW5809808.1 hypothetical protein [Labilithrix sp.]